MSWTDSTETQHQQWPDPSNVLILQHTAPQATTIFQQFPAAMTSPFAPVRPGGHIRENLVELMMIQNTQMHQVIMNHLAVSALNSFNYSHKPETARIEMVLEEDPGVYHYHYPPVPDLYSSWMPLPQPVIQVPPPAIQNIQESPKPIKYRDRRAVPPTPPPSLTQTVEADTPPPPEFCSSERGD